MDVELTPGGCTETMAGVLSFGLVTMYLRSYRKQLPATLTEDRMVLRNGVQIPWKQFTRLKVTDVYYRRSLVGSRYELWHSGGKMEFGTNKIMNSDAVVQFVLRHLPPQVVKPGS